MKEKKNNLNLLFIVSVAVVFGLAGGVSGGLITRSFLVNDIYSVPFYGKVNFTSDKLRKANFIIENAKNITVEQDKKINDTIKSASESIVGIFKKKLTEKNAEDKQKEDERTIDPRDHYRLSENQAQALAVTSDGWLLLNDFGQNISDKQLASQYVAITRKKEIYEIDKVYRHPENDLVFIHMKDAQDIPVREFSFTKDLDNGQLVIAIDWQKNSFLTYVVGRKEKGLVRSSEELGEEIVFADNLSKTLNRAFVVNLNGDLAALVEGEQKMTFADNINPAIQSLLSDDKEGSPYLGANYIKLSDFVLPEGERNKGALLYPDKTGVAVKKGSPADKAGLKQGDIIISVDNQEINDKNELSDIMSSYSSGDSINLVYVRNGEEDRVNINLNKPKTKNEIR